MSFARIRALVWLTCLLCGSVGFAVAAVTPQTGAPVVVVPIEGTVDQGMAHLVARAVDEANAEHASAIALDVNSNGGLVDAAQQIRDSLFTAKEPVIAFVSRRAYSAAALITLSANRIVMAPGASIGAAEPRPAEAKYISALRGEFESTALRNHRDATVAGAMVDKTVDLPQYKRSGAILTLNTDDAVRAHIADATATSLDGALAQSKLQDAPQVVVGYTWAEQIARFATDPVVSGLLLSVGMLGLLIEMQTMHGIAGTIGVAALVLFFGSHIYSGFSNGLVIALAIVGLLGILWELHVVPGHGFPGIIGGVFLLAAVVLAFGVQFFFVAVPTLASAIILTVICFTLFARAFPNNAWARRLALAAVQGPEYVASEDHTDLRGQVGTAVSFLRPAGIASVGGQRVDVLTEGEFIPQGTPVRVVRVEGARVFVEALPERA